MTTTTPTNDRFITPNELAFELGIHKSTVNRWMHEGRIPFRKIGPKKIQILRTEVQELLEKVAEN